jgi:nucleoid-associated protein YgaU
MAAATSASASSTAYAEPLEPVLGPAALDLPGPLDGAADDAPQAADRSPTTWTVQPGEHLWAIAEQVVGPGATEPEVSSYWARLVTANRDVLVDPDCPDLLFVGQVLELPAP